MTLKQVSALWSYGKQKSGIAALVLKPQRSACSRSTAMNWYWKNDGKTRYILLRMYQLTLRTCHARRKTGNAALVLKSHYSDRTLRVS